ncbi:aldehyde dehydrogenase family protein [Streptococcus massiliensis]|uniref:Aldehyde dehydrogenase n=1 Tax=Streptococcus massiliensis TaxID=313439 RepID=A0A380KZ09_9STRE|nr:aldehyde dehydrogenase family protein [Streptococcus massiliensis]SUN77243.1 aldehyde dehydrogenase [Streptococcus massiliensis]
MGLSEIEQLVKQILSEDILESQESAQYSQSLVGTKEIQGDILEGKETESGVFSTVDQAVQAAKIAQKKYFDTSIERRKKIIAAIRSRLLPEVEEIAKRALEETGMGNFQDKIAKNRLALEATPGVEDLMYATRALTGDNGLTLYEMCPYGVIGAIAPSTNPTETIINNSISMLAAGNTIYFAPHPGARETTIWLIRKINKIAKDASGIDNLIVTIENPSIQAAQEMMVHPDIAILVVTGGPGVVAQAMKSGKKVIGAGAGNPPAIVDETANIEKAGQDIVDGASFDNNIPCTAEKNIIVVSSVAEYLIFNMQKAGAFYVKDIEDIKKLENLCLTEKGTTNKKYVGKSAEKILTDAGVTYTGHPRLVIVEGYPDMPFAVEEMLMPVVPLIRVPDFDTALEVALELEHGYKHTATIHSQNVSRLNKAARAMETSIFVKNGPSFAGLGLRGEGPTTFTIATPTGEGTTTARSFARIRRCVLSDAFMIR